MKRAYDFKWQISKDFQFACEHKISTIYGTCMHSQRSSWEQRERSEGDDGGWQCQIQLCTHNVRQTKYTHTKELMYKRMSHVICSVLFCSDLASLPCCILSREKNCLFVCVYSTSDAIVQKYSVSDTHHRHFNFNFNVIVLIVFDLFYVLLSSRPFACSLRNCCTPMWWYTIWINAHCF